MNFFKYLKYNYHIGCLCLFSISAVLFVMYSVPKLKQYEKQNQTSTADIERLWTFVDSVHHEQLMEDPMYESLYEENEELKERMERIKSYTEDIEVELEYFEEKGIDISDIQVLLDDIYSECE